MQFRIFPIFVAHMCASIVCFVFVFPSLVHKHTVLLLTCTLSHTPNENERHAVVAAAVVVVAFFVRFTACAVFFWQTPLQPKHRNSYNTLSLSVYA